MYKTDKLKKIISVEDYLNNYVDIPYFMEKCKECNNYNKAWCCPPYEFSVEEYWKQYKYLCIIASKIIFDEKTLSSTTSKENVEKVMKEVLDKEKQLLSKKLYDAEKKYNGSISLSAGSCNLCENCEKLNGNPCIYPDKMRYSIESLGGNVGKTCSKLLGIELVWCEEEKLPEYFTLVSGLLTNNDNIEISL
ncbi:DUF2284 domain-containing protein [Anaerovorax odorimutans]|uniref:DUF2284 domain-containing protein n=1 Tax=Anaerovorax odorimutans TaxID=109327 RepID=UPI0003FD6922|nr:DUF2284 domain-containing protein [Anaerovorax odorimutans]